MARSPDAPDRQRFPFTSRGDAYTFSPLERMLETPRFRDVRVDAFPPTFRT